MLQVHLYINNNHNLLTKLICNAGFEAQWCTTFPAQIPGQTHNLKTFPKPHMLNGPDPFTLSIHLERRRATSITLCGPSFRRSRRQSSYAKQGPCQERTLTKDWSTKYVRQTASSSMVTPNVAWKQQLETLHCLCFIPLSERHMAPAALEYTKRWSRMDPPHVASDKGPLLCNKMV